MAEEKLNLDNIGGGTLRDAFDDALARVSRSFDDKDLDGQKRKIVIEITMAKEGGEFVKTTHMVKTELPVRRRTGMAWQKNGEIYTESLCVNDRQMSLAETDADGNVTPIGKAKKNKDDKDERGNG